MKFRPIFLLFFAFTFVSFCKIGHAQLPDSFNGWTAKPAQNIRLDSIAAFAGNDSAVIQEYGLASGEHREYKKNNEDLSVTAWKMKDSSGSLGLFTFYREAGTASIEGDNRIAVWPNRLVVQHGAYVIDARGPKLTLNDAKLLIAKFPALRREDKLLPPVSEFLPDQNLIPQSAKFIMGPTTFARLVERLPAADMGFDLGAEAELAQYRIGGKDVGLLLMSYATPQLAAKELKKFEQLPALGNGTSGTAVSFQRKGPLVCFVLGAPSASAADTLIKSVRYESEVTWNQPAPSRRDNIGDLILNIFLLCGFLLLFAIVAGLSYGGIRVLAKKFLPIPVFDRPSQVEIIRLHLSDQ